MRSLSESGCAEYFPSQSVAAVEVVAMPERRAAGRSCSYFTSWNFPIHLHSGRFYPRLTPLVLQRERRSVCHLLQFEKRGRGVAAVLATASGSVLAAGGTPGAAGHLGGVAFVVEFQQAVQYLYASGIGNRIP